MNNNLNRPAINLVGKTVDDGWAVVKKITPDNTGLGGYFAVLYLIEKDGKNAFLKALDFSFALQDPNPTKALVSLAENYEFEKELLELCLNEKLTKVVKIISQGNLSPEPGSIIPVPYFILEYSESNLQAQIDLDTRLNTAWLLKVLHNVSVGLYQIHKQNVAIKKLNAEDIRAFGYDIYKLAEFGYAGKKGVLLSKYPNPTVKDISNLTIEGLYGYQDTDWIYNNQSVDAYHLGSLILFLFTQTNMTTCMSYFIDESHMWTQWSKPYEDVLPYLLEAFDKAVQFIYPWISDIEIRDKMMTAISELCNPDPRRRGHPKDIASVGSISVYRYITMFDRLSKLAKIQVLN